MRRFAKCAFALAVALGFAHGVVPEPTAWAQTEAELAAARKLFSEGLKDEQAKRYEQALDEFQRVQQVRDTQQVRYRVATCLEALGRLRQAIAAYTSASVATGRDADSQDIARASREKVEALSKRVAHLVVTLSPNAPSDAQVKIDGEAVQANALGTTMVIDPGAHEITATATGATPFHAQISIPEGGDATINVPLEPGATAGNPAPPPPPPATPPAAPAPTTSSRQTLGIVAVSAGGVLVAGGITLLVVRHAEIAAIERACPNGVCPRSRAQDIPPTRSRALVEGPVALGLGAVGLAAVATGVYLLATPERPQTAVTPWITPYAGGVTFARSF